MSAPYDNNCSKDIRKDDLFMNIHERSRTVREQRIVGEHVTLNVKIRKLSNKQTNIYCSRTVHEQIYKHQTLNISDNLSAGRPCSSQSSVIGKLIGASRNAIFMFN